MHRPKPLQVWRHSAARAAVVLCLAAAALASLGGGWIDGP